jgi:3-phosphoshikimate 1-carboxyvinyltransferase
MPALSEASVRPASRVTGRVRVPGDKSISHRYALFGALAHGETVIRHFAPGADCAATLECLRTLGADVTTSPRAADGTIDVVRIVGRGLRGLDAPRRPLDARNSGTTLRLLCGILAAHPFEATLAGDESLNRRPMKRVIEPLTRMGARIASLDGHAPLHITGGPLRPIEFEPQVPSAQVKSAVLLAGMQTPGTTVVREPVPTRNHTELGLRAFGARIGTAGDRIAVDGEQPLTGIDATVPGDFSSATFWAVAAAALQDSDVEIVDVGLNTTRTALLDVLGRAGAQVDVEVTVVEHGERRGTIRVRGRGLQPLVLAPAEVPGLIDELPALAAMATHGGDLHVTGAGELRVKESDRIRALAQGLRGLGCEIEELPDGFHVRGGRQASGGVADAATDHRLAIAFAIAALGASQPSTITGADAVSVSYPSFFTTLAALTGDGR